MSLQENKSLVQKLTEQVFNKGDLALLPKLVAGGIVDHSAMPGAPAGIEGYKGFVLKVRTAYSDFHFTLEDILAEDDRVVIRGSMRGTNDGAFLGMPATGKPANWTGIHVFRLSDNRIVEHWGNIDLLGLMGQLGHVPSS